MSEILETTELAENTAADEIAGAEIAGTEIAGTEIAGTELADAEMFGADISETDISETDISDTGIVGRIAGAELADDTAFADAEPVAFTDLGLPEALVKTLAENGVQTAFPIQAATIPDALAGRHVLGKARTGSGKTLAFGLAALANLRGKRARKGKPLALVLVPTRELAMQVTDALQPYGYAVGADIAAVYGGAPMYKQVFALRRGVELLVATPGRLTDLIEQEECDLSEVSIAILDEADQMADMGFLPIVSELLSQTDPAGQRLLFSATLDGAVDELVRQYLHDPVLHSVTPDGDEPTRMDHHLLIVEPTDKALITAEIAARHTPGDDDRRTILFARTKLGADRIAEKIREHGVSALALHGGMTQRARTKTLADFKDGRVPVLVATDVAARGIHVDGIDLVLHVDPAGDPKDYLHRAGRTARAGESGTVVTLVLPKQRKSTLRLLEQAGVEAELTKVAPSSEALRELTGGRPVAEYVAEADAYHAARRAAREARLAEEGRGGRDGFRSGREGFQGGGRDGFRSGRDGFQGGGRDGFQGGRDGFRRERGSERDRSWDRGRGHDRDGFGDRSRSGFGGERRSFGDRDRDNRGGFGGERGGFGGERGFDRNRGGFGGERRERDDRNFRTDRNERNERGGFGNERGFDRNRDGHNGERRERESFGGERREREGFGGERRFDRNASGSHDRAGSGYRRFDQGASGDGRFDRKGSDRADGNRSFGGDRAERSQGRQYGADRAERSQGRDFGGDRRSFGDRDRNGRGGFGGAERRPFSDRNDRGDRSGFGGERRSFDRNSRGDRNGFDRNDRGGFNGDRRPRTDRTGQDRGFNRDRTGGQNRFGGDNRNGATDRRPYGDRDDSRPQRTAFGRPRGGYSNDNNRPPRDRRW